jgi:thioredoxin 1
MAIMHLTDNNWNEIVSKTDTLLVSFVSEHCKSCLEAEPALEQLEREFADRMEVGSVDVHTQRELTGRFGIMAMPTFMLFRNGEPMDKKIGFWSKDTLFSTVQGWLEK